MLPQSERSSLHVDHQPKNMEKNSVQMIMMLDISGRGTNEIAQELDMTPGRISIIKNSPLYIEERSRRFQELKDQLGNQVVKKIVEDPARKILQEGRTTAAEKLVSLVNDGKNEFVQKAAAVDVLEFSGIMKERAMDKKAVTTVVMEEKLAQRFGFAKGYQVPTEKLVERTVTITHEA